MRLLRRPQPQPRVAALVAAELDTEPPHPSGSPRRTYVVCSTQRSGSNLLCSALQGTGAAGIPAEYFNIAYRAPLAIRWGARGDLDAYARELLARRTSPAGVFGVKIHWAQLDAVRREAGRTTGRTIAPADSVRLLAELFPDATYVHLTRSDTDRQAISFWRALHSGAWFRPAGDSGGGGRAAPYNFRALDRLRTAILRWDELWSEALERSGADVVAVVYEDLVTSYRETIASLLERTTGHSLAAAEVPEPASRAQSDAQTEELLERFRSDTKRGGRPVVTDVRERILDLSVRARTYPYGAVAGERLDELRRGR